MKKTKLNVAILGSGNIGTDILMKIIKSKFLHCICFIGRRAESRGIMLAKKCGIKTSIRGINEIIDNANDYNVVFDATSALEHVEHAKVLCGLQKTIINLTPADSGCYFVPVINSETTCKQNNFNMVTCGGQASIPIAWAISQVHPEIEYIEVVTNIASKSAGPATRRNIDEYLETTEKAIRSFSGCKKSKVILTLNPAEPPVNMQTSVMALVKEPKISEITSIIQKTIKRLQTYIPGYKLLVAPVYENGRLITTVQVRGSGDYLPEYAGNLDIITCAAVQCAELIAKNKYV